MWISVEDRLPEKSCECLVATNIGGIYQVNYSHRYKAFNALDTDEAKYAMRSVTHWMPLPEPPKMGEWVQCKDCTNFEDCETKEDRDGCYLGDTEDK